MGLTQGVPGQGLPAWPAGRSQEEAGSAEMLRKQAKQARQKCVQRAARCVLLVMTLGRTASQWGGSATAGGWSGGATFPDGAALVVNTVVVPGICAHDRIHRNAQHGRPAGSGTSPPLASSSFPRLMSSLGSCAVVM